MSKMIPWFVLLISLPGVAQADLSKQASSDETSNSPKTVVSSPVDAETTQTEMMKTVAKGEQLHEAGCMKGCHDSGIYTRKNRKITHLEGLKARVQGCATNLNLPWFDDESAAVVSYLDHSYYHFKQLSSENSKVEAVITNQTKMTEMVAKGKQLHDANCMGCHDTSVYIREDRRITRLDSLKTHVQRCATNLDKPWFDDELAAVAAYLNQTYYKFEND
jgi:cytochrome c5